ncbi:hypothetical protein COV19_00710 [Candidatus Woesearchaeota archaeon CG10_big_fil_rev_8_21_14_0_10_44_13]|nr:MAG: hypothetical protein COV19_00710 [Candidatus Woesearchaeota archaeon CG10_big_fil_rev_8_21_14_0_10_44_13]
MTPSSKRDIDGKFNEKHIGKKGVNRCIPKKKRISKKNKAVEAQKEGPSLDSVVETITESGIPRPSEEDGKETKDIPSENSLAQEIKLKKDDILQKTSLYKKVDKEYDSGTYAPGSTAEDDERSQPSQDTHANEDLTLYKLKKDADPLEKMKGRGLPVPWQNEFLNYLKDKINHTMGGIYTIAKKGYNSTLHYPHAAYSNLYNLIRKKK